MKIHSFLPLMLFISFATEKLSAEEPVTSPFICEEVSEICSNENVCHGGANRLAVGPEFSYFKRSRKGGTKQTGNNIGVRANYDHIKRYKFYWGGQAYYGTGTINGHSSAGKKIRSKWTDEQIEGSLGYTFQSKNFAKLSFTPFGGFGYLRETNQYVHPSPLCVKFMTHFSYFTYGFISSIMAAPCLSIGANLRMKSPWDAKCKASHDPKFDNSESFIGDSIQYRIEIPIVYYRRFIYNMFEAGLMPFYEVRHYGGRINFPFDYIKTEVKIFGINFQLIYQF